MSLNVSRTTEPLRFDTGIGNASFAEVMDQLINDPEYLQQAGKKAGDYINTHTGATLKCYNAIFGEQKAKEKEAE